MTTTPIIGAPELVSGQAVPETTVNEIVRFLEQGAAWFRFIDRDLATPPGSPADGDCYLVDTSATGVWSGHDGDIAFYLSSAWAFITPAEGMGAYVLDEDVAIVFDGAAWGSIAGSIGSVTVDTDGTLAANSDAKIATQKATKTYVDNAVTGLLDLKGGTDCSANPNYPAGLKGDTYKVTVAGKIGGASGKSVDVGDVYIASADNAGGTEASVGTSWFVMEHNLAGALLASNNLSDVTNAGTARSNLGLAIGSNVQAYDADLDALAALSGTNTIYYRSAANTWTAVTIGAGITFSGGTLKITDYTIGFFFTSVPTVSEVLLLHVAGAAFTIPANFSGGLQSSVGTNPTASFALDVQKNGSTIGTITVGTGGAVTATTTSGTSKSIAAGDVIKIVAPSPVDATAANMAFTIIGAR